ncbi:hypothetical protein L3V59_35025 [Burkholderia aenigmatica]|uniref:hypothetical protein n=1 Tax=Burkholderia aenigmatica TaxID=2015348 RepID=UPI001F46683C|nr:hypothetical protein [Burkholderia aenigmatica]UKD17188.1 hypothetical protein L3V59_35025 [Burkholderia aenigmatica]
MGGYSVFIAGTRFTANRPGRRRTDCEHRPEHTGATAEALLGRSHSSGKSAKGRTDRPDRAFGQGLRLLPALGRFTGRQRGFESWAKTHPDVHLFIVEREAIAVPETIDSYPPVVQWLFERRQRLGNLSPGTPTFEIFVRRNIVWKSYGLHSWDRDAFPALKDLDSRRVSSDVE